MTDQQLRMDAYYYGFDETGVSEVDLILSAVACAGKSFHHTDQWNDEDSPWPGHTGNSPIEWIRNAAASAAQEMARLKAENERLQASLLGYQMGAKAEAEEADRLRGEVKELRKDAERYRWIRATDGKHLPEAEADAEIDAAMAKEARS